ncbi:glycine oxidase ThiO [Gilvimarinus xylanilyticus]|uniref:D-amino-acid oxidase n=1 Tax=Gilvimarinus xylanilyticus TaxID=2944139 RepID=A0A9X2I223_9GAMM|nr:glycine oxidase ThiO [Gilvimarinus xylanilyticus]MCP8898716.1 glycine oxidase ThiO [Gilvimarinus xylanilyticus]
MNPTFSPLLPADSGAHIGIAGAGLLGQLLAWQLSMKGFQVSLFDAASASSPNSAAHTAAGMLAPISEAAVAGPEVYTMGLYGLKRWQTWLGQLGPQASQCFHRQGSLLVAHPQDECELQQFLADTRCLNNEPDCAINSLNQAQLQQLEPDLSQQFRSGLLLEPEGHLDNREILEYLRQVLQSNKVAYHEQTPVEVAPYTLKAINTAQQWRFDLVIDCRGAGARHSNRGLRGVRGETLHLQTTEVHFIRPVRLMHPRYQLYVVPKPDHRFVIGATQIESEDTSPISVQSSLELSSAVYTLAPAFAEARILEAGVNLRPAFSDNLPQCFSRPGLLTANGLFRHGYLLAPAFVDHLLAQISQSAPSPFASYLPTHHHYDEPVYE